MEELLNPDVLTLLSISILIFLGFILRILHRLVEVLKPFAELTPTTKDDEFLERIEKALENLSPEGRKKDALRKKEKETVEPKK